MTSSSAALLIPAFNEADNIGALKQSLAASGLDLEVFLVDDGSTDDTAERAKEQGFRVIRHATNLGIGPAVQSGIQAALETDAEFILRMDADLQHPAEGIPALLKVLQTQPEIDLVVASRYLGEPNYTCTPARRLGTTLLAWSLSVICNRKITDPTSGFLGMRRTLAEDYAAHYPKAWPETEALIQAHRHGFIGTESPVPFLPRQEGRSSIYGWKSWAYVGHTLWVLCTASLRNLSHHDANREKR